MAYDADTADLGSLLANLNPSPDAMSQAMRRLGMLGQLSGDRAISPIGQDLVQQASQRQQQQAQAATAALHYGPQLEERREQLAARRDPRYASALRGVLGQYGVDVDDQTPPMVMEKILGPAEKFAQAQVMAQFRGALQNKLQQRMDPNTGEVYLLRPLDGATFHMNGSPRTAGVEPTAPRPGAAPSPARPAPAATPTPVVPTTVSTSPEPKPGPLVAPPKSSQSGPLRPAGGSSGQFPPMMGKPLDKAIQAFGNDLDPNKGTGEIQKNQSRLNAAIRLRKLVTNEDGSVKDMIPPQFMKETAMALAQLVNNGGQPAQTLIEELTPRSKSSKWADMVQWITDNPQDAGQQGFVKLYLESANREAQAAQEAMNKAISGRVGKHMRLIKGNPDAARQVAQSFGWNLDPEKMSMSPLESAAVASGAAPAVKPAALSEQDQAAKAWAEANPKDPRAAKILERLKAKGL